jgi:apolipoprotein D and lipocalin family protein
MRETPPRHYLLTGALLTTLSILTGCAGSATRPPIATVDRVDLERFMGDWYVIASIPTALERGAHNAIERYELDPDGTISTTFTFREDSFEGKQKTYHPRGFVRDPASNAVWGMQFVWPIKADYRIVHLDSSYTYTAIGRNRRDYVWIMARTPTMPDAVYDAIVRRLGEQGYDTALIRKVPQRW